MERRPYALDLELDAPLAFILICRPLAFDLAFAAHQTGSLFGATRLFCHGGWWGPSGVRSGGLVKSEHSRATKGGSVLLGCQAGAAVAREGTVAGAQK